MQLTGNTRKTLLLHCLLSIEYGLAHGAPLPLRSGDIPEDLQEPGASFVTLTIENNLRGCIGSLEPHTGLLEDIVRNAYSAAFRDPRFSPLAEREIDQLEIHVSILGKPLPLDVSSEQELAGILRPGIDGLILQLGNRKATFLPSVWESLQEPVAFIKQLKLKAGIPADEWSDSMKCWRYLTQCFSSSTSEIRKNLET